MPLEPSQTDVRPVIVPGVAGVATVPLLTETVISLAFVHPAAELPVTV